MLLLLFLRLCQTFIQSILIFKSILNKQRSSMNIQLSLSCSLLTNRTILLGVLEQIVRSRRGCTFLESNCDCQHEVEYGKIRMVCTGNRKGGNSFGIKLWLADDIVTCGMLSSELYHIVYNALESNIDYGQCKNVVSIVDLNELGEILTKSVFELQKRCKMQYILRRTHKKYEQNHSKSFLFQLFKNYIQSNQTKSVKVLKKFMILHHKLKISLFQRYFNAWRIVTLEGNLSSLNEELVSKQMLLEGQNKRLLVRCFRGWKLSKQNEFAI